MRPLLGTFVEIAAGAVKTAAGAVEATAADRGTRAEAAIQSAFDAIANIHALASFQQADSELSRLNASPGQWLPVSRHTLRLLRLARAMTAASDHLFNCTLGGAVIARGALPDHGGDYLKIGCADDIELEAGRARLARPVRITLDGIAKGYAVDCAIAALKCAGVSSGWINAGGDLRVFGDMALPVSQRRVDGSTRSLGALQNAALATSCAGGGVDADVPGLILGPETADADSAAGIGKPATFSVISRFAWRADALTKVAALAPASERAERVARLGGLLIEE
ncbi:FAD:protein FMN transferase [Microbulbifer hainanensis]|uniref:FAD:protein FMN transferase n=1 Tax=Microbulbifer hainanensis TaxID=2735675 RepID=UPI001867D0C1|nr:FAD:protein FMN transferase [Microbulbifer hainanensis]